jgi:hypothetical protein
MTNVSMGKNFIACIVLTFVINTIVTTRSLKKEEMVTL